MCENAPESIVKSTYQWVESKHHVMTWHEHWKVAIYEKKHIPKKAKNCWALAEMYMWQILLSFCKLCFCPLN